VTDGFRLLMSHDPSHYMVLQPHPLIYCVLDVFDSCGIWLVTFLYACLVSMVIAFLIA
jgi:hypothetical protein